MTPELSRRRYRLKAPTIATVIEEAKGATVTIPAGGTITIVGPLKLSGEANRQVEIQWLGKPMKMFVVDILERGEPQ